MAPEHALGLILVGGLVFYVLGGGADFGGGVWDLLAAGPRAAHQRELIERTIGPIWEANHVWFIFVFVLLFSAFPPAFATITTALFTPLTLYALGLVMRGSAFVVRHYEPDPGRRRRFGAIFSAASVGCPFLLGAMGAALLREAPLSMTLDAFVLAGGFFTLALVAALAATYLTLETDDAVLKEDFRRRALAALAIAGAASWVALASATSVAPALVARVGRGGPAVIGLALGAVAIVLVARRQFQMARLAVGGLATVVVSGWAWAKGDVLVWGQHTIGSAKAHAPTLTALLGATVIAGLLVVPSLALLYRVFSGAPRPTNGA